MLRGKNDAASRVGCVSGPEGLTVDWAQAVVTEFAGAHTTATVENVVVQSLDVGTTSRVRLEVQAPGGGLWLPIPTAVRAESSCEGPVPLRLRPMGPLTPGARLRAVLLLVLVAIGAVFMGFGRTPDHERFGAAELPHWRPPAAAAPVRPRPAWQQLPHRGRDRKAGY